MSVYFDNAATSDPKPNCVLEAVRRVLTQCNANPGRSGHRAALEAGRCVLDARETLRHFIGAEDPSCIVFTANCTDSLNLGLKGSLNAGDHVITTMLEHNSVLRPLHELARRGRISLTVLSPRSGGFIAPEDVENAILPETSMICMTQASNVTGGIQPVAAVGQIAKARGLRFLIDGAQALGKFPVDVRALGCDLYAFPGHKSLLGPQGVGGLYIRSGLSLTPLREGGTGTASDSVLQPDERPERYESGTVNLPGIAGMGAGCRYAAENISQIMSRERELTAALYEGLSKLDGAVLYSPREESACAGIVTFNLGDLTSSEAADAFARADIAVRGGLHCAPLAHQFLGTLRRGAVRASLGHANTFAEVEQFLKTARQILRG